MIIFAHLKFDLVRIKGAEVRKGGGDSGPPA